MLISVKLRFLGGCREIGRISVAVKNEKTQILLDYGVLFNDQPGFPMHIPSKDVQAIFLSHAHLDHSGGIPIFHITSSVPVYATKLTFELVELLISDFIKLSSYYLPFEFLDLKNKEKWEYVESLMKEIRNYKIQAEKNCLECEKNLLTTHDLNIDLYFEDWRDCAENCDECNKETRTNMCELQLNLINHLANSICNLEDKFNTLARVMLNKSPDTQTLLDEIKSEIKQDSNKSKEPPSMYQ